MGGRRARAGADTGRRGRVVNGWILFLGVDVVAAGLLVRAAIAEDRKTKAWLAAMERRSRQCPCCMGLGWIMDDAHKAPTCSVCNGTGELPDPSDEGGE